MLDALWPLLAPRGTLLYATCSILPAENGQQIARFLQRNPDAEPRPIDGRWGHPDPWGRQILTAEDDLDGFYYALLQHKGQPTANAGHTVTGENC